MTIKDLQYKLKEVKTIEKRLKLMEELKEFTKDE